MIKQPGQSNIAVIHQDRNRCNTDVKIGQDLEIASAVFMGFGVLGFMGLGFDGGKTADEMA